MIILRDPQQLSQVVQSEIKTFLQQRFHDICDPEPYNPDEHGFFIFRIAVLFADISIPQKAGRIV